MSEVLGEFARVGRALNTPGLSVFARTYAQAVLAILQVTLGGGKPAVDAERFYSQVDEHLKFLRSAGYADLVPSVSGRQVCLDLVKSRLLTRRSDENGVEWFDLTAAGQNALQAVDTFDDSRVILNESRMATLANQLRHLAVDASANVTERVEYLNSEIDRLARERDRLLAGDAVPDVSSEKLKQDVDHTIETLHHVHAGMKQVSESLTRTLEDTLTALRDETSSSGEVVRRYVDTTVNLLAETPEGRGYLGAQEFLRSQENLTQMGAYIDTVLSHDLASDLTARQRETFATMIGLLMEGMDSVVNRQRQIHRTLNAHLTARDFVQEREIGALLNNIERLFGRWAAVSGTQSRVEIDGVELTTTRFNPSVTRERFYDPLLDVPPEPLKQSDPTSFGVFSRNEMIQTSGPQLVLLRNTLIESLRSHEICAASEFFHALPDNLRRPVDMHGLLHIAATVGAMPRDVNSAPYETLLTLAPDGSTKSYRFPKIVFSSSHVTALTRMNGNNDE